MSVGDRMIDRWFPCVAVDEAIGTPVGSGKNEKAIFPWFASRPIAQARAAVLCSLLPDEERLRPLVDAAIRVGDREALGHLAAVLADTRASARRPGQLLRARHHRARGSSPGPARRRPRLQPSRNVGRAAAGRVPAARLERRTGRPVRARRRRTARRGGSETLARRRRRPEGDRRTREAAPRAAVPGQPGRLAAVGLRLGRDDPVRGLQATVPVDRRALAAPSVQAHEGPWPVAAARDRRRAVADRDRRRAARPGSDRCLAARPPGQDRPLPVLPAQLTARTR